MQQHNQHVGQDNRSIEFEKSGHCQRKIRSTSHSRLCSSSKSVKNIPSSKSIENGEKNIEVFKKHIYCSRNELLRTSLHLLKLEVIKKNFSVARRL